MDERLYPDLDYAFLRYTGVVPENQRRIQSYYLPFFEDRQRVLDLACGDGDFVQMLTEQGITVTGVDFDPKACEAVRARGLDVVCQDVFDYLEQVAPESVDGIFSAHLVEHLAFQQVLRMLELSLQVLKPGGIILLVTPNVRSMYAHLESYHKHFGHISFYHPELLCFFLDYVGFSDPQMGENPHMATPLWGQPDIAEQLHLGFPSILPFSYQRTLPQINANPMRRFWHAIKMFAVRMVVQPYIDQVMVNLNQLVTQVNVLALQLDVRLARAAQWAERTQTTLDRPVECFVYANKPETQSAKSGH